MHYVVGRAIRAALAGKHHYHPFSIPPIALLLSTLLSVGCSTTLDYRRQGYYDGAAFSSSCIDLRPDCDLFKHVCRFPDYEWYMTSCCRRTCGRCGDYGAFHGGGASPYAFGYPSTFAASPGPYPDPNFTRWHNDNRWDRNRDPTDYVNYGFGYAGQPRWRSDAFNRFRDEDRRLRLFDDDSANVDDVRLGANRQNKYVYYSN